MESVETLRDWIVQETEFHTIAAETIKGITTNPKKKTHNNGSFFSDQKSSNFRQCKVCNGKHGVWVCEVFHRMDVSNKWDAVKKEKLCFYCLGDDHYSKDCKRRRKKCGVSDCDKEHHKLLNFQMKDDSKKGGGDGAGGQDDHNSNQIKKGDGSNDQTLSTVSKGDSQVALRTIPVILSNGRNKLVVNALLDDESTKLYVNSDVAFQMGSHGSVQRIQVGVLNGKLETLDVMPVELIVESLDGKVKDEVSVFTVKQVTGGMKVVNWNKHKDKWNHIKEIIFPEPASKKYIDILLGMDYPQFHTSVKEVKRKKEDPVARLTPLGWTCVGQPVSSTQLTNFIRTFHGRGFHKDLDNILCRFWEIEEEGTSTQSLMTADEKKAIQLVHDSMKYKDGQYEVGLPWRRDPECLSDNYNMAVKRLMSTERKLSHNKKLANEYNQTIEGYINKGYVRVWRKNLKMKTRNGIFHILRSSNQKKKQLKQDWYLIHQQLKMV